jgi:hypothetical protein
MRMTWIVAIAALAVCATTGPVRADDRDKAVELVEKAIKAHGGEDALNRSRSLSRTGEGVWSLTGNVSFTEETVMALPDRLRLAIELNKSQRLLMVVNDDKGWQLVNGAVQELPKERLEDIREEIYVMWIATLTPLLKEPFKLTPVADVMVNGAPAAGVKVSAKGHKDARLYFDKRSDMLVKIERRAREIGLDVEKSYLFSDYKDVDGVKLPCRETQLVEGKKLSERTSTTYKLIGRPDEAAFAKP